MAFWFDMVATAVTAAPGTGSTSLTDTCARSGWAIDVLAGRADAAGHGPLDAKHATVTEIHTAGLWAELVGEEPTQIVTTTRDPYDFYVAEWYRTRTRWAAELDDPWSWVQSVVGMRERIARAVDLDFDAWLHHELSADLDAGRSRRLNPGHVDEATIVLRMEHLDDDLARLHPELFHLIGRIPHVNRTVRPGPIDDSYTPWGLAAVTTLHHDDIERFGYRRRG